MAAPRPPHHTHPATRNFALLSGRNLAQGIRSEARECMEVLAKIQMAYHVQEVERHNGQPIVDGLETVDVEECYLAAFTLHMTALGVTKVLADELGGLIQYGRRYEENVFGRLITQIPAASYAKWQRKAQEVSFSDAKYVDHLEKRPQCIVPLHVGCEKTSDGAVVFVRSSFCGETCMGYKPWDSTKDAHDAVLALDPLRV